MDSSSSDEVCCRHHASPEKWEYVPCVLRCLLDNRRHIRTAYTFSNSWAEELGYHGFTGQVIASLGRFNFLRVQGKVCVKAIKNILRVAEKASEGRVRRVVIVPLGYERGQKSLMIKDPGHLLTLNPVLGSFWKNIYVYFLTYYGPKPLCCRCSIQDCVFRTCILQLQRLSPKIAVLSVEITKGFVFSTYSSSFAAVFLTPNTKQRLMKLMLRQPQVCFMQRLGMRRGGRHRVYVALKRTSCLFCTRITNYKKIPSNTKGTFFNLFWNIALAERGLKKYFSATSRKKKNTLYYFQSKAAHFKHELKFSQAIANGNTLVLPFKK